MESNEFLQPSIVGQSYQKNGAFEMHAAESGRKLEVDTCATSRPFQPYDAMTLGECSSQFSPLDVAAIKTETQDTTSGDLCSSESGE